jgi:AcrR family transcriptional regulator
MAVPQDPQDPIRKQLVEARRAQILDAAASVIAAKGFHRATTRDIAIAAGVAEGTIYNYFEGKDDLLISIVTRLADIDHLSVGLEEALRGDVKDFIIAMFRHRMQLIRKNHEMIQAVLPEMLTHPALRERFYQQFLSRTTALLEQYVGARVGMGQVQPVDVALAVRAIQSTFVGMLVLRMLGDELLQARWDEMPEVLGTIVFEGLRTNTEGVGG